VVPAEIGAECLFVYRHKLRQILPHGLSNFQLWLSLRKTDFFKRGARKIEDEIHQCIHKQKAALFQSMNYGRLVRLHFANYALRSAFDETSEELVD